MRDSGFMSRDVVYAFFKLKVVFFSFLLRVAVGRGLCSVLIEIEYSFSFESCYFFVRFGLFYPLF